jgi:hypothetical protein
MDTVTLPIRRDWAYDVNVRGQHLVFNCENADRMSFERAVRSFARTIPPPRSGGERDWLRDRLAQWFSRHAGRMHLRYHPDTCPAVQCSAPRSDLRRQEPCR